MLLEGARTGARLFININDTSIHRLNSILANGTLEDTDDGVLGKGEIGNAIEFTMELRSAQKKGKVVYLIRISPLGMTKVNAVELYIGGITTIDLRHLYLVDQN